MASQTRTIKRASKKNVVTEEVKTTETTDAEVTEAVENFDATSTTDEAVKYTPNRRDRRRELQSRRQNGRKRTQQHVDSPQEWGRRMKWIQAIGNIRQNAALAKERGEAKEVILKSASEEVTETPKTES